MNNLTSAGVITIKNIKAMKHTETIIAAAGGLLVGAALALVFAPQKGEHLRHDIKKFLKDKGISLKKNKLEELVDEIVEEIK